MMCALSSGAEQENDRKEIRLISPISPIRLIKIKMRRLLTVLTLLLTALTATARFTAKLSDGDVAVELSAEPEVIDPARDFMLTITVTTPAHLEPVLPDIQDRFRGFSMAEDFTSDPVVAGGSRLITQRWKLTPEPAAERYRLSPFAVSVKDISQTPPTTYSFATKPVIFPAQSDRPPVTGKPEVTPEPEWIAPTAKTIALWVLAAIGGALALAAALYGLTRISARVREFRMSPIERAMTELERLLRRKLPEKGLFKDFYVELTMVVRRYIERSHDVRAPEQTTEEFLAEAARHPDFTPEVLAQLKVFLESADLVKFAGQQADLKMTEEATEKARKYMKSDAELLSSVSSEST
jgi:hypothetical protein